MSQDPGSLFGPLVMACIKEDEDQDKRSIVVDGTAMAIFGIVSGALTFYLLSLAGIFV